MKTLTFTRQGLSSIENKALKTILEKILFPKGAIISGYRYSDDHSDYNDYRDYRDYNDVYTDYRDYRDARI